MNHTIRIQIHRGHCARLVNLQESTFMADSYIRDDDQFQNDAESNQAENVSFHGK